MADRTSSGDKDRGRSRSGIPHARRTQRVPQTPRVPGTSHVWMLADDRPGNVNQALGLAEALGEPFEVKTVGYSQLARLPNWLLPANLAGLTRVSQKTLKPPWPDLVIGAGRRTARIGRWLKRQHPGLCLVQLMWPGSSTGFDLIAVPEHDRVPDDPVLLR
ncbi:MAG: ELM1/GtrOC1 family putative glycosyltransferase, partial [Geminicoccaceae bacterium]